MHDIIAAILATALYATVAWSATPTTPTEKKPSACMGMVFQTISNKGVNSGSAQFRGLVMHSR